MCAVLFILLSCVVLFLAVLRAILLVVVSCRNVRRRRGYSSFIATHIDCLCELVSVDGIPLVDRVAVVDVVAVDAFDPSEDPPAPPEKHGNKGYHIGETLHFRLTEIWQITPNTIPMPHVHLSSKIILDLFIMAWYEQHIKRSRATIRIKRTRSAATNAPHFEGTVMKCINNMPSPDDYQNKDYAYTWKTSDGEDCETLFRSVWTSDGWEWICHCKNPGKRSKKLFLGDSS